MDISEGGHWQYQCGRRVADAKESDTNPMQRCSNGHGHLCLPVLTIKSWGYAALTALKAHTFGK